MKGLLAAFAATVLIAGFPPAAQGASRQAPWYGSIAGLQQQMRAGKLSSVELTRDFLQRIKRLDQGSHGVNAIILLNPNALKVAAARDHA